MPRTHHQAFGRRIATDKFIQLFFVLNFSCLVGIIVWYAVKKGAIKAPHINIPPLPNPFSAISGDSDPAPAAPPAPADPAERMVQRYLRRAHQGY